MMKICKLIEDILPLYMDGLLQEETKELVDLHLCTCPECKEKARRLKATVPAVPPNPEEKIRLRRVKRKIQLRSLLISSGSLLLAVGIFLAAYLPYYLQKKAKEEEIRARENLIGEIESNLRLSDIIVGASFEIIQAEADGKRAECDGISFRLPTDNFREIENGYYGNYEFYDGEEQLIDTVSIVRYESYDQLNAYEYHYDSTHHTDLHSQRMGEFYDRGYELMKLRGVENNYLNLALAAGRFDFDVIHNEPTDDELALAVFFSCNYRNFLGSGSSMARWFTVGPTIYYEFFGSITGFLTYTTISSTLSGGAKSVNTYWRAVLKNTDERYYYIIDITDNDSTIPTAEGSWQSSLGQIQWLLESIKFE